VASTCHLLSRWFLAQLILRTLKMDAICSSETSVDFHRTTRRYIPEDSTLHNHRCENLKSYRKGHVDTLQDQQHLSCAAEVTVPPVFRGFPQSPQANNGKVLQLGHERRFLPHVTSKNRMFCSCKCSFRARPPSLCSWSISFVALSLYSATLAETRVPGY
jgi:hypothetical protein